MSLNPITGKRKVSKKSFDNLGHWGKRERHIPKKRIIVILSLLTLALIFGISKNGAFPVVNAGDYNTSFSHTRTLIFGDTQFLAPVAITAPVLVTQAENICAGTVTCAVTFTATAGDELIVAFHEAGDSCLVPPTVTDSLTNTYTNLLCAQSGSDISLAIFGTVSIASGSDTITTHWTTTFSSTVVEYSGVSGIGPTNSATGSGTGTFTSTVTLTATANSAVFEAFAVDSRDVGSTCATNSFSPQNGQSNTQSLCISFTQNWYLNEWNSISPAGTNFGIQNTGVCTTGCPWSHGLVDLLGSGGTPSASPISRWNYNSTCVTAKGPTPREVDFDWSKGTAGSGGANCNSANIMISKSQVNFQTAAGRDLEIIWMAASLNSTNTQSVDLVFRTNSTLPNFSENYNPFNDTNAKLIYEACTRFSTVCKGSGQTIYIQHDPNKSINNETRGNDFVVSGATPDFKNNAPVFFQAVLNFTGPNNYINEQTAISTTNNSNNTASALQMGQSYNIMIKVNTIGSPVGLPALELTNTFGAGPNNVPAPLSIWSVPPSCADPVNRVACGLSTPQPVFQFNPLDPSSWGNAIIQGLLWVFTVAVPTGINVMAQVLLAEIRIVFNTVGTFFGLGNLGDSIVNSIISLAPLLAIIATPFAWVGNLVLNAVSLIQSVNLFSNPYFAGLKNFLSDFQGSVGSGIILSLLNEIAFWFPTSYMIILITFYFLLTLLNGMNGFFDWIRVTKWSAFGMFNIFARIVMIIIDFITAILGRLSIISPGHKFPRIPHLNPGPVPHISLGHGDMALFHDPTAWFFGVMGTVFTFLWAGTTASSLPGSTTSAINALQPLSLVLFGISFMVLILYIPGWLLGKMYDVSGVEG